MKSSNLGSIKATVKVGVFYINGTGVQKNVTKGIQLLEKAANELNSDAFYYLGKYYLNGIGVSQDKSKGIEYYQKSSDLNNSQATFDLGCYYDDGYIWNNKKSFEYFQKAEEQGSIDSYYKLAVYYQNGRGTKRDIEKAKYYYTKASNEGNQNATNILRNLRT